MLTLNLAFIVQLSSIVGVFIGILAFLWRLSKRFEAMEERTEKHREDNIVILQILSVLLEAVKELSANGTQKAIAEQQSTLREFIINSR